MRQMRWGIFPRISLPVEGCAGTVFCGKIRCKIQDLDCLKKQQKNYKIFRKNLLTKGFLSDIICKLSDERGASRGRVAWMYLVN